MAQNEQLGCFGRYLKKHGYSAIERSKNRFAFIGLTLFFPLAYFAVFWLYVNIDGIFLAFKDPITMEWTMDNFVTVWELLTLPGGDLKIGLRNTMFYFIEGIALLFVAFIISYFLYKKIWGHRAYRIIFYIPGIISSVVLTTVFKEFIKTDGPLGAVCSFLGIKMSPLGLLGSETSANITMLIYVAWMSLSGSILLFVASLSRLPEEVFEAARLDGCGPGREAMSLVLPMIFPMFSTLVIMQVAQLFGASGPILLFTQGKHNTTTISYWMFTQVYGAGGYGGTGVYGLVSAWGIVQTIIGVPLALGTKKLADMVPSVDY